MLSVTPRAKEMLREELQKEEGDDKTLIRIGPSPSSPARIGFEMDREKERDRVISDNEGRKLLLIGHEMAPVLTGMVLDIDEEKLHFTITRP